MALKVANFEKVSKEQFEKDWLDTFGCTPHQSILEDIILPRRATEGSAGHDFVSPIEFKLEPGEEIKIPTGIRCGMHIDWALFVLPRSGMGFKYRARLSNTLGLVDSDYYYSDNEGHIFVKLTNEGNRTLTVKRGEKFCQGVFLQYGTADIGEITTKRNGGMGSTGDK